MNLSKNISLRAARPEDNAFLYSTAKAASGQYVIQTYGEWDDADQQRRFAARIGKEFDQIIQLSGVPVGCLSVKWESDHVYIVRIYLDPKVQGLGIGSYLVKDVLARAKALHLPVRLRVFKVNPALKFWRRHGFAIVSETETHWSMEKVARSK